MQQPIKALLDTVRGAENLAVFAEQFAACCAYLKLVQKNSVTADVPALSGGRAQLLNHLKGFEVLNLNVQNWQLADERLQLMLTSLTQLLQANVINYADLSVAIHELLDDSGKMADALSIPTELTQLAVRLLGDHISAVYCPFIAGYQFAQQLPPESIAQGETLVPSDVFYAQVSNFLLERRFDVVCSDPIYAPTLIVEGGLKAFDSAVALPPFARKYHSQTAPDLWGRFPEKALTADVYQLRHLLAHSRECVVAFVTSNFLYRSAAGEKLFKQDVLNKNWLKAVIALPSNLLAHTAIEINILVFEKHKTKTEVLFIDASGAEFTDKSTRMRNKLANGAGIVAMVNAFANSEYSQVCGLKEIAAMEYNLSPSRYVLNQQVQELKQFLAQNPTCKLAEIADIVRPQALKHEPGATQEYIEYNLTSLNAIGQLDGAGKAITLDSNDVAKAEKQTIRAGDVLVSCRGAVGKIALVDEQIAPNALASQAFAIVRLKPQVTQISSGALYQYLISAFGQRQLAGLVTGTTAAMLAAKDLNNLDIPLFSAAKLAEFTALRAQVVQAQQRITALQEEIAQLNTRWLA
ncbi:MAG: N-6 DNA methylase [Shewanella sp.]|uniref:N-6 DNA methylase n=1 Tax=Shewanella sp. TaxID=50422 RepID=UPI003F3F9CD3